MKFEELAKYYQSTLQNVESATSWYPKKRKSFRFYSQAIRLGTVLLAGLGGILPLVELAISSLVSQELNLVNYGYVAFSLAASLFLIDKYFGYSTGWMRFMLTELELRKVITQKKSEWLYIEIANKGKELTEDETSQILDFIKLFNDSIDALIVAETKEWINEFKSSYQSLEKLTQQKSSGSPSKNRTTEL